jgi:hypothetical protein
MARSRLAYWLLFCTSRAAMDLIHVNGALLSPR